MSRMSQSCAYALMVAVTAAAATAIHAEVDTGTYTYDGTLPTVTGDTFTETTIPTWVTDPEKFQGTIWLKNIAVTGFTVNPYGNESSKVKLTNISGWLNAPNDNSAFTNTVPVELDGTLTINNGYSANDSCPNRCTVFKKLSGSGAIYTDTAANKVVIVIQDASEFTGNIGMDGKLIVFGDTMPSYAANNKFEGMTGSIWVMEGASVTANPASGNWWAVGGIKAYGEFRTPSLDKIGGGTYITTYDSGKVTLTSTGNGEENETDASYARISGTGTLKYEGTGWRALSTNNFPTAMTVENEQAGDLLLSRAVTYTIGSLSGSKNFQGNYGSGDRYLRVLQSKDTEWSGIVIADTEYGNRFKGLIVAPGVSTSGTLTLSGTQPQSRPLTVEAGAKVNLTGTWVGATTVAGTIGGTGAIIGDLTLSDGATLNIPDLTSTLVVTGNLTATTGTINVRLPANVDFSHFQTLLRVTGTIDLGSADFAVVSIGDEEVLDPACYSVRKGVLKKDKANRLFVLANNHGNRIIFR